MKQTSRWQLLGALALGIVAYAPGVQAQSLQFDNAVKTGKLPNGFTYYIRENKEPQKRAELYLVIKAGSILETDKQQGLAHFMEHMSFNGTKNFPKNELVEYLQKSGVRFGADLNAHTSFDETVYQLPIATDNPEIFKNAMQVMRDWAGNASLDAEEIDKERGVIIEEKRTRMGAQQRVQDKTFPVLTNGSKYAVRLPIGTDEVLKNFKHEEIRSFYKDWYRPNLEALIVVGDVDAAAIEKQVKQLFGDMKNPAQPKQRTEYAIPLTGKNQFLSVTDAEVPQASVSIVMKQPGSVVTDKASYKKALVTMLMNQMIASRLSDFNKKPGIPLLGIQASYGQFIADLNALNITITPKEGQLKEGVLTAWEELSRIRKFGFTAAELKRANQNSLAFYERMYNEKDKRASSSYVEEYQQHFLKGDIAPGIDTEYKLAKELLPLITLADVNAFTQQVFKDKDRDVLLVAPDKMKNDLPTEQLFNTWLTQAYNAATVAYSEAAQDSVLLAKMPAAGKVTGKKEISALGITELTLSNGVKVVLKPTDFQNDAVMFTSFSKGGTSLYADADYQSAANAATVLGAAGLGNHDPVALPKLLTGKQVQASAFISELYEGINGASSKKDIETALQLVYLYFTSPRIDTAIFRKIIDNSEISIRNRYQDPKNVFSDTIAAILSNYNYRRTAPTVAKLKEIDLQTALRIYKERFANAGDFTFVFTGSFDIAALTPLLEQYLGSLPATGVKENYRDLNIEMPTGHISKTVFKGREDNAAVRMMFTGDFKYSEWNDLLISSLGKILQFKLTERLREVEGGVYSPSAGASTSVIPKEKYTISAAFGCAPANVEKLIAATLEEMEKMKNGGITADDLQKFRSEEKKQDELKLRNNRFWLSYIAESYRAGTDLEAVLKTPALLDKLTVEDIKQAAKTYLDGKNYARFVLMPEK